jgi:hypothetical protein
MDVLDTHALVVAWQTICLLMILSAVLALVSKQVDYMAAYIQVLLGKGEQVYVEM